MTRCFQLLNASLERRFENSARGLTGLVICRSPWQHDDVVKCCEEFPAVDRTIGVNFSILEYRLDFCFGGDPIFWTMIDPRHYPNTLFLTGYNPGPPKNTGKNVIDYKLTVCRSTVNAMMAMLWAEFIGLRRVFLAGAHYRTRPGAEFYGDMKLENMFPDPTERRNYVIRYGFRMPQLAREMVHRVGEMRRDGIEVVWPGESSARQVIIESGQEEFPVEGQAQGRPQAQGAGQAQEVRSA